MAAVSAAAGILLFAMNAMQESPNPLSFLFGGGLLIYVTGQLFSGRLVTLDSENRFLQKHGYPEAKVSFDEISGLQVLCKKVASASDDLDEVDNTQTKTLFEMNIVCNDGSKINLIVLENQGKVTSDAKTLAGILGVPMWEGTA
jgi:hypothetical protein